MQDCYGDPSSLLDSNKLELEESVFFFGLCLGFSWTSSCNAFKKRIALMRGLEDNSSLLERDLLELIAFALLVWLERSCKGIKQLILLWAFQHRMLSTSQKTYVWLRVVLSGSMSHRSTFFLQVLPFGSFRRSFLQWVLFLFLYHHCREICEPFCLIDCTC